MLVFTMLNKINCYTNAVMITHNITCVVLPSYYYEAGILLTQIITKHRSLYQLHYLKTQLRKESKADSVTNIDLLYALLHNLLFGRNERVRSEGLLKRNIIKFDK